MNKKLYYEELEPGNTIETPARTITDADIQAFAAVSGDANPLHLDPAYAAGTPFGERIAHGILGLSAATGLAYTAGLVGETVEAFTNLEWKFRAPIKIDDTIRARITVSGKRALPDYRGGFVTLDIQLFNQHDEIVQKGQWTLLIRGRPAADPA